MTTNTRMPAVGDVNVLETCLGQRGKGKSTHQCARARELECAWGGAHVIGHSLGARMPREIHADAAHDGRAYEPPIEYHHTIRELEKGMHARPNKWHFIAPPALGDPRRGTIAHSTADELIHFSMRLSQGLRDRAYNAAKLRSERPLIDPKTRNYDGLKVPPVIVIIDEGIAVSAASSGKGKLDRDQQRWFFEWLISLRHLHTALLYSIQNPSARSWYLMSEATEIDVFYIRHQWALNAVQAAGGTSDQIREIRSLPPHEFVVIDDVSAMPEDIEQAAAKAPKESEEENADE